ncbi:MAG TPA: hypothetical protein VHA37_04945 [Candidatus Saccharimonadales bacterium]|nr:hypothetical protein [Candidatus Saccharimonadales bacterium]
MTRFLTDSLAGAAENSSWFRAGLRRLEAAQGHPNEDIRFSTEVERATQAKVRALGLDPHDTTPQELYHVLQERLRADDARLTKRLRTVAATHVSAEGEVVSGMVHALQKLPDTHSCFALKSTRLRALLKKQPPKKAMKQLGYRSMDSFLKHETPVSVLAAAWLSEGTSWQQRLLEQYKQLGSADFETRRISITRPDSRRWRELAARTVVERKHNILCFRELGALVLLPLPADAPPGAVTASLSLALHELNQIRASSSFLKLCQVRPDFGELVELVARDDPQLSVQLFDQPVPWQLIQRYYARVGSQFRGRSRGRDDTFEPHLRLEDMAWHPVEASLSAIDPDYAFWQDSAHLGVLHEEQPVSLNIADVALGLCNRLPFERRVSHYFRQSLWHELLLRYLDHDAVEQSVMLALQPELAEAESDDVPVEADAEERVPA